MKSLLKPLLIGFLILNQSAFAQVNSGGGFHALQLCSDGTVKAWGRNANGQLGNSTYVDSSIPVQVYNLSNVTAISSGGLHSLAIKSDSTVWAWGMNTSGQLGNGNNNTSNFPVQVNNLTGIVAISAGAVHSMALKSDGTVWAWGSNANGRLGIGTTVDSNYPVQVTGLTNVKAISGAGSHSLALKNDSTVWTWGHNNYGQLGNGTNTTSLIPVQTIGLSEIVAIDGSNRYSSVAIASDSTVWSWGYNEYGQLGNGVFSTASYSPVQAIGLTNVVAVELGEYHAIALKSDSTIWTWGRNDFGQLGHGTAADSSYPAQVANLNGIEKIANGMMYSYSQVVKYDGTIWSWGSNFYGNFGTGATGFNNTPIDATILCNVTKLTQDSIDKMFVISPNPASNFIDIKINDPKNKDIVQIFGMDGALQKEVVVDKTDRIQLDNFASGVYLIKLSDINGLHNPIIQKVIVNN